MSEHPPIPDEFKELFWKKMSGQSFSHSTIHAINEWITEGAAILWREWTRGMAVVPLPEPDGSNRWDIRGGLDVYAEAEIPDVPAVWHRDRDYYVDQSRQLAAALLAAADRAEQLAAQANAEGATS